VFCGRNATHAETQSRPWQSVRQAQGTEKARAQAGQESVQGEGKKPAPPEKEPAARKKQPAPPEKERAPAPRKPAKRKRAPPEKERAPAPRKPAKRKRAKRKRAPRKRAPERIEHCPSARRHVVP